VRRHPKQGAVTLSFDDGWKSIYDNGFPILKRAGFKATHYIVSGYLDESQFALYMHMEEVKELELAGHEIGCHSVSHRHLPQEPFNLIQGEVVLAKKYLANHGITSETFAYPYGEFDDCVVDVVKTAGFRGARCTERGFNDEMTDPFLLKVQAVKVSTQLFEVVEWLDQAIAENKWLILMFHQIDTEGREWSCRPEMLQNIVDEIARRGIRPVTVREMLPLWT
jgi:peptidoglycan/xylan/chitin deacetylase (PgdA/CDA1 family)